MPCGEQMEVRAVRYTDGGDEGDEASRLEVAAEGLVNMFEGFHQAVFHAETGSCVGMTNCRNQRGPNPVPGDVSEGHYELPITLRLPVKIIATGIVGRLVPSGDVEPCNLRWFLGKKRLLDGS